VHVLADGKPNDDEMLMSIGQQHRAFCWNLLPCSGDLQDMSNPFQQTIQVSSNFQATQQSTAGRGSI